MTSTKDFLKELIPIGLTSEQKIAMSKDGKTSFKNKRNKWITPTASRNDAQHYRAISDLIITGRNLMHDNPSLNVRNNKIITLKDLINPTKPS